MNFSGTFFSFRRAHDKLAQKKFKSLKAFLKLLNFEMFCNTYLNDEVI